MLIVCVRHLPTEWNQSKKLQGKRDMDILEIDAATAAAIQANQCRLDPLKPFDGVLASSLKRTQQTAASYGYNDTKVEPLLDELDFGPYEGRLKSAMETELAPHWQTDPREVVLGEPVSHLEKRILAFLAKYGQDRKLLIFGHGSWIRGLLSVARYGDVRAMNTVEIGNNDLVTIRIDGSDRPGAVEIQSNPLTI